MDAVMLQLLCKSMDSGWLNGQSVERLNPFFNLYRIFFGKVHSVVVAFWVLSRHIFLGLESQTEASLAILRGQTANNLTLIKPIMFVARFFFFKKKAMLLLCASHASTPPKKIKNYGTSKGHGHTLQSSLQLLK